MIKFFFIITIFITLSYGLEQESMDNLLDTFVHNSDLSKKTHLENVGNMTIITREELDKMQAHNLRDVMKSLPMLNYVENRWAIPDPIYISHRMPFNSNSIRIYIDNQEVSTASYGSGLFHLGTMDIGFIDHIEVYTLNPSFEYSTESARYLIKLYSKVPKRDRGSELKISGGSNGFNQESYQYANIIDGISYFSYLSRMDDKRKKYKSFDTLMSRNQERYSLFSAISNKEHHLQIQAIKNDKDMFMGISSDGKTQKAKNKTDYLHVGYENSSVDNLKLNFIFEKGISAKHFKNDYEELKLTNTDKIFTAETQYKWYGINGNKLITGAKHRYKSFGIDKSELNGNKLPKSDYNTQSISSFYLEDHYELNENWLLSLGTQFSHIYNNSNVENQNTWMARAGIIYSDKNWVAKTFLHRAAFLIEPYNYNLIGIIKAKGSIRPEEVSNITQEIRYQNEAHKLKSVLGYSYMENTLTTRAHGQILNKDKSESTFFTQISYDYQLNMNNAISSNCTYTHSRNLYRDKIKEGFDEYKMVVRLLNRYGKFDIFNEFIYNYNSFIKENYLDYSAGVKYPYNDNLIFSLKGENILNSARKDYFRRGRKNLETEKWENFEPLFISPVDQKIYFTVDYLF